MPDKKSFLLRIAPEVYDSLAGWAAEELRSMNGQVEFLLRDALSKAGRLPVRKEPAREIRRRA